MTNNITLPRATVQQALEALEEFCESGTMLRPIERREALRTALEQQQAEPVAWNAGVPPMYPTQKEGETFSVSHLPADDTEGGAP